MYNNDEFEKHLKNAEGVSSSELLFGFTIIIDVILFLERRFGFHECLVGYL